MKKLKGETLTFQPGAKSRFEPTIRIAGHKGSATLKFRSKISPELTLAADVMDWKQYVSYAAEREPNGMWVLFTPSSETDTFQTGHLSVFIHGHIYTRSEGPGWDRLLQNLTPEEIERGTDNWGRDTALHFPYAIAQFFELPSGTTQKLNEFFSDRVWNFYNGWNYSVEYNVRPHQDVQSLDQVKSENCTTFAFSFLYPRWEAQRGDLMQSGVAEAFGEFPINPIPTVQTFINTGTVPYRGSLLISRNGQLPDPNAIAADLHAEWLSP